MKNSIKSIATAIQENTKPLLDQWEKDMFAFMGNSIAKRQERLQLCEDAIKAVLPQNVYNEHCLEEKLNYKTDKYEIKFTAKNWIQTFRSQRREYADLSEYIPSQIEEIKKSDPQLANSLKIESYGRREDGECAFFVNLKKASDYQTVIQDMFIKSVGMTNFEKFKYDYSKDKANYKAYLAKQAKNKLLKIEVAVEKKLKADIENIADVKEKYINIGKDGQVEGLWTITLKDGSTKNFSFESIYAGGYNIQCLHLRTIYRYK